MVVNAPTSNIVSAAEHAVALLLAAARQIPAADASLREGGWKRSKFMGVEVTDKTVGVVGLGRIGVLVAQRLAAFGVTLIAYDPYIQPGRAAQLGVRLVPLEELLRESDFITIHLPKTPETVGLIGAAELATTKRGRDHRQRRPRRAGRRGGPGRRAHLRPGRRRGHRRLRQGAVHRQPAVRAAEHRRHPAPRRLDHRGAGQGRHRRGPLGAAGAAGRVRARTRSTSRPAGSSPRTSGRACRWPRSSAGCSPPSPAGLAQSVTVEVRGKIAEFDVSVRAARRPQGRVLRRRRGAGDLRERAAAGRAARPRGRRCPATSRAPTTAT